MACAGSPPQPAPHPDADAAGGGARVVTADPPSETERFCAWYGHAAGPVLYFGQSAFWSQFRAAGGRPEADLEAAGPARIGRFDLRGERLLSPLDVGMPDGDDRSGVWDVHAHPNGRVYFTTFFDWAGSVDPATGEVRHYADAGRGLNEIAPGPDGSLILSRYGSPGNGNGALVRLRPDGSVAAEHPLSAPAGFVVAPKTVAWDPLRGEYWLTTDVIPADAAGGAPIRHDTIVLDRAGKEVARFETPEVQFVAFDGDGTGYRAEVTGSELVLRILPARGAERRVVLDRAFAADFDFVQDVQPGDDGRVALTRWSGWVHVVDTDGDVRSVRLPDLASDGLYYTAVAAGERVCATHCADVTVVCRSLETRR